MITRIYMLILAAFFSINVLLAQQTVEVKKLSLREAVEMAKTNNYTVRNVKLDQLAAEKKVNEILSNGLPQINASGNFTNNLVISSNAINFGGQTTIIKFGQPYTVTGSITATQLLFDGGFFLGVKAAKEYVNLAKIGVKLSNTEIEAAINKLYFAALISDAGIKMMERNLELMGKTLNDLKEVYKAGLREKIDVDRMQLSYSNTNIQLDKLRDQLTLSYMVLKMQLGLKVTDSIALSDNLEKLYGEQKTLVVENKINFLNRPDYQMVDQQIKLQDYDRKRYLLGYAPSLSAMFSHQQNTFGEEFSQLGSPWYNGTFWALNLNVPIFDGLRKSAQIQQTKINKAKFENSKKNLESTIENDVEQARLKYVRAVEQLSVQKKNVELAEDIYNQANVKFTNGVGSNLELSSAENDMKNAQTNYLSSIFDLLSAQVDLKKALGQLGN
ncbi:MAG: TolC family protein [Bacteroidota bacterium]